jgi:hypothetical protein
MGQSQHTPNVKYVISPNGTIMIYVSCSDNPFRLQHEEDITAIMVFLGRVEERLRLLFADTRDEIVRPVNKWVLKSCDVNKDIEIDGLAQLTLPDIQIPLFEKALRAYVKPIGDKVFYRVELGLTPNKPVAEALETLRRDVKIDKSLSL